MSSKSDFIQFYNQGKNILGAGMVVRTGLGWDPTRQDVPGFASWSDRVLEPALARGVTVLPGIRTLNLDSGGEPYRMPTDAQWTHGLRQIVRMYGPNGVYAKGGSYVINGRTVKVAAHPGFRGLTDYELWNEPNPKGNLNGAMTPARITHLLRIGSAAMRDEARKMGFAINIIGPAIGGIDVAYLEQLWKADNNLFNYIDTLSIHAYMRLPPSKCSPDSLSRLRCVKTFVRIRQFMDSHGGSHVRIGTTEGGFSGDRDSCRGPQVLSESEQRTYSVAVLKFIRARPQLKFDFWITFTVVDGNAKYRYACDSTKYDIAYWEQKLGVYRSDLTLKPWGARYRQLVNEWR